MRKSKLMANIMMAYSLFSFSLSASAQEVNETDSRTEKSLYKSDLSTVKNDEIWMTGDNPSRIKVGNGVIYSVVDIVEVNPELSMELSELPLLDDAENDSLTFQVRTNYSDYIKRYELILYSGDDLNSQVPIQTINGLKIKNEDTIKISDIKKIRGNNKQLKYKLRVFDKDGNFDETTDGYIEFRQFKTTKDLTRMEQEIKAESKVTLLQTNIPARYGKVRIIGQNLKNVKEIEINGDKYTLDVKFDYFTASRLLPTGEQSLQIKITFDDGRIQEGTFIVDIPETYYSGVGVADFTIGRYQKNEANADDDKRNLYKKGRLAYYGKAQFNKDTRAVFQFDTEEKEWDRLFDDFFRKKKDDVYQRLRQEDYYLTYGDDSIIINENNLLQQGKIYTEFDYKKSRILWGTYQTNLSDTELSQVNRSLYGAFAELKSDKTTDFGENQYNAKLYAAQAEVGHGRNEFLGTGGSLYFLQHGDIIKDSESVVIEVRNRDSGLVEKRISLFKGKDYRLDDYQGRIILTQALNQSSDSTDNGIIKTDLVETLQQYLVVDYDYEYTSQERIKNLTYGGRVQGWLNESVAIGGTHVHESQSTGGDFELNGVDAIWRYSSGTFLKGEYSRTKNTQTQGNYLSSDGGLTFQNITDRSNNKSGSAYLISGNLNLHDLSPKMFSAYGNGLSAWYKKKGSGFSMGGYDNSEEQNSYGARLGLRPSDNVNLLFSYSDNKTTNYLTDVTTDRKETLGQAEYMINSKVSLTAAVSDLVEKRNDEIQKATLFAGRVAYTQDDFSVYGIAQTALRKENYDYDQIYTIGLSKEFPTMRTKVTGEYSITNQSDDSFKARLEVRPKENYSVYTEYNFSNVGDGQANKVVFGNRYQSSSRLGIYTENQLIKERDSRSNLNSYGIDYDLKEKHRLGLSYQEGQVKTAYEEYDRRAVSLSSNYDSSNIRIANKLEYRVDTKSATDAEQFVSTNSVSYKLTDSFRVIGSFDYLISKNRRTDEIIQKDVDIEIGFAYRPVKHNRFNWLGKYIYIENQDYIGRSVDRNYDKKHILMTEAAYKLNAKWSVGPKIGYKKETYQYPSSNHINIDNEVLFYGLRTEYQIVKKWDLLIEYRGLQDLSSNDFRQGAVVGVYRSFGNYFKAGIGYNFSKINDDLRNDSLVTKGWFINFTGKM